MSSFKDIAEGIIALHCRKDEAYGNAFEKSFRRYEGYAEGEGLKYAVGRMGDKMGRIENLAFRDEVDYGDESIIDTLRDLAAYAIMTVECLEKVCEDD